LSLRAAFAPTSWLSDGFGFTTFAVRQSL
jgi:hypothetical protein